MAVLERWSSYKKPVSSDPRTKFGRSWQVLVFFECTYIKEVQYNCSTHGSVHLFIIAISSHSHKERKKPQFYSNITMINIKKRLRRKIHELKTLIGTSDDSQQQARNKYIVKIAFCAITTGGCFCFFVKFCLQSFRFFSEIKPVTPHFLT